MSFNYLLNSFSSVAGVYGWGLPIVILMAITCSTFGVFVVLKRVVFIGVTLSEVAACGVALGLVAGFHPFLASIILTLAVVAVLSYPFEFSKIPRDAVLGTIFILASGMSILLVAKSGFGLEKVKSILFGSLLFASNQDLFVIFVILFPALIYLLVFLKPTLYTFLDRENSKVLGIHVQMYELMFFSLLGLVIAASSKVAGVMLVFCYLVVGPATSLILFRRFKMVLFGAAAISVISTFIGIHFSYIADLPPNQSVAVSACVIFGLSLIFTTLRQRANLPIACLITIFLAAFIAFGMAHLAIIHNHSNVPKEIATFQSVKPIEDYNEPDDFMTQADKVIQLIEKDQKAGLVMAVDFLQKNPPDFFKNDVIQAIEKALNHNINWNADELAQFQGNKEAAQRILQEAEKL